MSAKKEEKKKVELDFGKVGKVRFIVCLIVAFIAVVAKAAFVVPIKNVPIAGTSCEAYSSYISLPEYLSKNRTKSCENYEVSFFKYMLENVLVFAVIAGGGFALSSIIPQNQRKKK